MLKKISIAADSFVKKSYDSKNKLDNRSTAFSDKF